MANTETLCSGCANYDSKSGDCKLSWVTRQNQAERVANKYCEDAEVLTINGLKRHAPVIIIPENWLRFLSQK